MYYLYILYIYIYIYNYHYYSYSSFPSFSPLFLSCTRQTLVVHPRTPVGCRVTASSKSIIYILGTLKYCIIDSCEFCTVFVASCETVLAISHCTKCTVIAPAGRISVKFVKGGLLLIY